MLSVRSALLAFPASSPTTWMVETVSTATLLWMAAPDALLPQSVSSAPTRPTISLPTLPV